MITKKTTLLFDLDGTLFDSIPIILLSFQETFAKIQVEYPGDEEIKKHIGTDLREILRNFLPEDKIENARKSYRELYLQKQDRGLVDLFPNVSKTLYNLKGKNYTFGIITSKMQKHSIPLLKAKQIYHLFDVVIGTENVKKSKPNAEPLFKALKHLNKKTEESVYIGDALIDMQASQNANMDFVAITTGTTTKEAFQKNKQKIVLPNLTELQNYF